MYEIRNQLKKGWLLLKAVGYINTENELHLSIGRQGMGKRSIKQYNSGMTQHTSNIFTSYLIKLTEFNDSIQLEFHHVVIS